MGGADGVSVIRAYRYPEERGLEKCAEVKRHAAAAARAKTPMREHAALERLRKVLAGLANDDLYAWATVWMLDARWHGATGEGAYWAVASSLVNDAARAELESRQKANRVDVREKC